MSAFALERAAALAQHSPLWLSLRPPSWDEQHVKLLPWIRQRSADEAASFECMFQTFLFPLAPNSPYTQMTCSCARFMLVLLDPGAGRIERAQLSLQLF